MKKSRVLMFAAIEAYRKGGLASLKAHWKALGQYDHATLTVLANDTMKGSGLLRSDWWCDRKVEVFIVACADGMPLSIGRRGKRRPVA